MHVNPEWLRYPLGVILAVNYIYFLILLVAKADKWKWVRLLTSHLASSLSLAAMLVMTVVFGLTSWCGPSTWPFCIVLFCFMTVLGLRAITELRHWRKHSPAAVIIHSAIFIILTAAFFGSGDKVRIRVMAQEGEPTHMGISLQTGQKAAVPFVITLEDFVMESHPDGTPKTFTSHVSIGERKFDIMVNMPARIGAWRIYQVGYDKTKGPESRYSVLECVKDGWYPIVQTGLWIILAAGVFMILTAGRKKEDRA